MPHNLHSPPVQSSSIAVHHHTHVNQPQNKVPTGAPNRPRSNSTRTRSNSTRSRSNTRTKPNVNGNLGSNSSSSSSSTSITNSNTIANSVAASASSSSNTNSKAHKYQKVSTNPTVLFPSSAFLRDILSLVFILLALPHSISLCLLVVHILLGSDNFKGYKYLTHYVLFNDYQLTSWRDTVSIVPLPTICKVVTLDVFIFGLLSFLVPQRAYFNYLVIFSKTLISLDLIGSGTGSGGWSVASNAGITSPEETPATSSMKQFHSIFCFLIINYINYIIHWFKGYYVDAYYEKIMFINRLNFHSNKLYLILSVHIIVSSWTRMSNSKSPTSSSTFSSASVNCDESKLLNIYLDDSLDKKVYEKSIAIHNFENFITKNGAIECKKNLMQPFWSLLAASKTIIQKPSLFRGESTKCKNNGGAFSDDSLETTDLENAEISASSLKLSNFNSSFSNVNTVHYFNPQKMSIMLIDDSRILIKFVNQLKAPFEALRVTLNQINWSYFKIVDNKYLLIYGLTPLFQYEIDLIADESVVSHFVINTTKTQDHDTTQVLNKSLAETSSLKTLQISLVSKINNLAALRIRNKKFKKDEHKKSIELSKGIESLRSKISRYENEIPAVAASDHGSDSRAMGKLKGLQHTVMQLEAEIRVLHSKIEQTTLEQEKAKIEYAKLEADNSAEVARLEVEYLEYERRSTVEHHQLELTRTDLAATTLKNSKLHARQRAKQDEIDALDTTFKALKKEVSVKLAKKLRRLNENFSLILPEVTQETEAISEGYY